ncbi:DNA-directed RNA polymerases II and IV subunit 5A, partial [Linum perenne]
EKMALGEEEIRRLFRIRKTVLEMLRDRGYLIGDFEFKLSKEQFVIRYQFVIRMYHICPYYLVS